MVRDEIYNAKNYPTLKEKYPQNGIEYIFFGGGEPHISNIKKYDYNYKNFLHYPSYFPDM